MDSKPTRLLSKAAAWDAMRALPWSSKSSATPLNVKAMAVIIGHAARWRLAHRLVSGGEKQLVNAQIHGEQVLHERQQPQQKNHRRERPRERAQLGRRRRASGAKQGGPGHEKSQRSVGFHRHPTWQHAFQRRAVDGPTD